MLAQKLWWTDCAPTLFCLGIHVCFFRMCKAIIILSSGLQLSEKIRVDIGRGGNKNKIKMSQILQSE